MEYRHGKSRPVWGAWIEIRVLYHTREAIASRPVWGAWIEIVVIEQIDTLQYGRAPYGARGLKLLCCPIVRISNNCRAPYGARGLKSCYAQSLGIYAGGRAPYGARGLKFTPNNPLGAETPVAPRMGRVD